LTINPGIITITNLNITRDADAVGSSISVSWQTSPAGSLVDIYTLTGTFSASAASWTSPTKGVATGKYTDAAQVGNGVAKYYKIVPAGSALKDSNLTSEVVGKFDIAVGPAKTEAERLFISLPLLPKGSSFPAQVFGSQAQENDMLVVFDIDKNVTQGSLRKEGVWGKFPGVASEVASLENGSAYGYITNTARYLTVVGAVKNNNFNRVFTGSKKAEWIGNPYPLPVSLANVGLNDSSANATITKAAIVYHFDANAELVSKTDGMAVHTAAAEWKDGTLGKPSPLIIQPGRGYMLVEPTKASTNWNLSRPY
jgi:hypothetical protein